MNQLVVNIVERFKRLGVTQTELAREAGMSGPLVSMLLSGRRPNPTIGTLDRLGAAIERIEARARGTTNEREGTRMGSQNATP